MNNANLEYGCFITNCHFCSFHMYHCLYSFTPTRWQSARAEKHVTVKGKNRIVREDDAAAMKMRKQHPPIAKNAATIRPSDKLLAGAHDAAAEMATQKTETTLKVPGAPAVHWSARRNPRDATEASRGLRTTAQGRAAVEIGPTWKKRHPVT